MNTTRVFAALATLMMVAAVMSGGVAGTTPSIDTSTTDATSTTSELQQDTTIDNVSGLNDNVSHTLQVNVSPDDTPEFKILRNGSDTVVYRNDSMDNHTAVTAGGGHWNGTFVEGDIDDLERTVNENVTVDVVVYDADNETDNETTIQVHLNFTDDRTVENLDDEDADPDAGEDPVTTESLENTLFDTNIGILDITSTDFSTLDVDERDVNGEDSDVVLVFSNSSVDDDASAAIDSDVEDGDALYGMPILVDGDEEGTTWIRVYYEEVPDDVDEDDDTYAIYHDGGIGGENGIVINLGEDYEDEEAVAVTGTLNAGRITEIQHWARTSGTGEWLGGLFGMLNGNVLIGLGFVAGAPTARRRPVEDVIEFDQPTAEGEA